MQVNTDGLVLRGWYTTLTVAVYGTAERPHGHDQDSPPPPPPPPPQQPSGLKRILKQGDLKLTVTRNTFIHWAETSPRLGKKIVIANL